MEHGVKNICCRLSRAARAVPPRRTNPTAVPCGRFLEARTRFYSSHLHPNPNPPAGQNSSPPISKNTSRSVAAALAVGLASTSYLVGSFYPPTTLQLVSPPPAPPSPALGTAEAIAYTNALEERLLNLDLVQQLRKREGWYESRPFRDYPEERRRHALTSGSLRGPGKLAVLPIVFAKEDESEATVIIHVGRSLCGHDGIVHGGLLATLLDESLARNALLNLPAKVAVTANLTVNYHAPTRADQFISIHTRLEKLEGRKATISGTIRSVEDNQVLVTASALFIQPKYAHMLNTANVMEKLLGSDKNPKTKVVGPDGSKQKVKVPQEAAV